MTFRIIAPPGSTNALDRIEATVRGLRDGELISLEELARRLNHTPGYLANLTFKLPAELRQRTGHRQLYGNPKTIKAYQKHLLSLPPRGRAVRG